MATFRQKATQYLKNVYLDYFEVCKDIRKSAQQHPIKASLWTSGTALTVNLFTSNEGLRSYDAEIVSACNRLGALLENSRNPESYAFIQKLGELQCERRLREIDLGFSTLIYSVDSNKEHALYKYNCKYLRPTILEFLTEHIIDWGILGHWLLLEKKMQDYDINEIDLQKSIIENNNIGKSFKSEPI